ncbi:MAG: class I SAM-dependent methyltransferase [Myxococcota bacterium]|jgi:cyclopropane fatty-acyl-phospholipid synthase-like methyltransferase
MRYAFVLLALSACTGAHHQHTAHHRFDDAEAWAKSFESPERDAWQKPDQVIAALELPPDAKVADIGAATGYFPVRVARVVPQGHVYGVDVESSMVEYLNKRAATEGLANLSAVQATFDDAKIPEPVDVVMMVNTYHHIERRPAYFARLAASLKSGGRLAIIDFRRGSSRGPPDSEKVPPEQVAKELAEAGYAQVASFDFLPEQFFLVFTRPRS